MKRGNLGREKTLGRMGKKITLGEKWEIQIKRGRGIMGRGRELWENEIYLEKWQRGQKEGNYRKRGKN